MSKSKYSLLALVVTMAINSPAHAQSVADLVDTEMQRSGTPGIAVAITKGDTIVQLEGFGRANIEHNVPVHVDTLFKTGSTGAQFTAAAIMLLVEEGKIDLDAPVSQYLMGAPAKWEGVTIRHLLTHTSGIPATPNGDFRTDYSNAELLGIIAAQDINFAPGSRRRFSYAGYIVLGFVIEDVTGQHWSQFVTDRIFRPLGMVKARGIDERAIIPGRASGYEMGEKGLLNAEWISSTANSTADGSLYLSALDFALWAQAVEQRRLLSAASWDELNRPTRLSNGETCAYVHSQSMRGHGETAMLTQSGLWQGFQSYSIFYPNQNLTVTVLANGDGADMPRLATDIGRTFAPAMDDKAVPKPAKIDGAAAAKARVLLERIATGQVDKADFADYAQLDFDELIAQNALAVADLGAMQDFEPMAQAQSCAETIYWYRARYEGGVVEMRVGIGPTGHVTDLEVLPAS